IEPACGKEAFIGAEGQALDWPGVAVKNVTRVAGGRIPDPDRQVRLWARAPLATSGGHPFTLQAPGHAREAFPQTPCPDRLAARDLPDLDGGVPFTGCGQTAAVVIETDAPVQDCLGVYGKDMRDSREQQFAGSDIPHEQFGS